MPTLVTRDTSSRMKLSSHDDVSSVMTAPAEVQVIEQVAVLEAGREVHTRGDDGVVMICHACSPSWRSPSIAISSNVAREQSNGESGSGQ